MIVLKLTELIEKHADELARGLLAKLLASEKTADMRKVPAKELEERVYEVYRNLSVWLLTKTEAEVASRYVAIGTRRQFQGVRLPQLIWAIITVKEHLLEFLNQEFLVNETFDALQKLELIWLVDRFFNHALYYVARAYDRPGAIRAA